VAALDDDLDLPTALAVVREVLRARLEPDEKRWLVLDADLVLGLDLDTVWQSRDLPVEAQELISARGRARAVGDYATADALREELRRLGVEVVDQPAREVSGRGPRS
jgi:cysteinyl-tRNA synthetase